MCPRAAIQNEEIRNERKQQILEAALTVYAGNGYAHTEIEDVAQEAGLARGLIYYYFKSKRELFQALFDWVCERTRVVVRKMLVEESDLAPAQRLRQYAGYLCRSTLRDNRLSRFFFRMHFDAAQVYDEPDWRSKNGHKDERHESLVSVIRQGMESGEFRKAAPALAAHAFWGALVACLRELSSKQITEADAPVIINEILTYCMNGLSANCLSDCSDESTMPNNSLLIED